MLRIDTPQLFVVDNHGSQDTTQIERIILYGTPIETTKIADLKKDEERH